MQRPLGLLIADDQQPDIEVSWLTIPSGEEGPPQARSHGAAEGTLRPFPPLDLLTGLPNRKLFGEHLDNLLRHRVEQDLTTVILFNIEGLGNINDTYGRHVGNILIQSLANRLRVRFGDSDNLAYFGAGVFAAVFEEHRQLHDADSATAIFGHPFAIAGRPISATVKCGLARYPADGQDPDALLHHAEYALNRIREHRQKMPRAVSSDNGEVCEAFSCEFAEVRPTSAEELEFD